MASLKKRNGVWYVGYNELGKWKLVTTKIRCEGVEPPPEVIAIRNEIERRMAGSKFGVASLRKVSVASAASEWVRSGACEGTNKGRITALNGIEKWSNRNVDEIKRVDGAEHIAELCSGQFAPHTVKVRVQLLRAWWMWCADRGMCEASFCPFSQKLNTMKRGTVRPKRALTKEEQDKIINFLKGKTLTATMIGLYSGCRISECLAVTPDSVDYEKNLITIIDAKSKRQIFKPLHPKLRAYLQSISPDDWPMGLSKATAYFQFKSAAMAAGCPEASHHYLRYTLAQELLHAGVDARQAAAIVGHSVVVHTQVYAHADAQRLASALDKCFPQ
jgi:site-specific recombinase XerD